MTGLQCFRCAHTLRCYKCGSPWSLRLSVNTGVYTPENLARIQQRCSAARCPGTHFHTGPIDFENVCADSARFDAEQIVALINASPTTAFALYFPFCPLRHSFLEPTLSAFKPSFAHAISPLSRLSRSIMGACSQRGCNQPANALCKRKLCKKHCQGREKETGKPCNYYTHRLPKSECVRSPVELSSGTATESGQMPSMSAPAPAPVTASSSSSASAPVFAPVPPSSSTHAQPVQVTWLKAAEGWEARHHQMHPPPPPEANKSSAAQRKKDAEEVSMMTPNLVKAQIWHKAHEGPWSAMAVTQPHQNKRILRLCSQQDEFRGLIGTKAVEVFDSTEEQWVLLGRDIPWTVREKKILLRLLPNGLTGQRLSVDECPGLRDELSRIGIVVPAARVSAGMKRRAADLDASEIHVKRARSSLDSFKTPPHEPTPTGATSPPMCNTPSSPVLTNVRPRREEAMSSPGPVHVVGNKSLFRVRPKVELRTGDGWEAPIVVPESLMESDSDGVVEDSADEDGLLLPKPELRAPPKRAPSETTSGVESALHVPMVLSKPSESASTPASPAPVTSRSVSSTSASSGVSWPSSVTSAASSRSNDPRSNFPWAPTKSGPHTRHGYRNFPSTLHFSSVWDGVREVHRLTRQAYSSISREEAFENVFGSEFHYAEPTWNNTMTLFKKGNPEIWARFRGYGISDQGGWSVYKRLVKDHKVSQVSLPWHSDKGKERATTPDAMALEKREVHDTGKVPFDNDFTLATTENTLLPAPLPAPGLMSKNPSSGAPSSADDRPYNDILGLFPDGSLANGSHIGQGDLLVFEPDAYGSGTDVYENGAGTYEARQSTMHTYGLSMYENSTGWYEDGADMYENATGAYDLGQDTYENTTGMYETRESGAYEIGHEMQATADNHTLIAHDNAPRADGYGGSGSNARSENIEGTCNATQFFGDFGIPQSAESVPPSNGASTFYSAQTFENAPVPPVQWAQTQVALDTSTTFDVSARQFRSHAILPNPLSFSSSSLAGAISNNFALASSSKSRHTVKVEDDTATYALVKEETLDDGAFHQNDKGKGRELTAAGSSFATPICIDDSDDE